MPTARQFALQIPLLLAGLCAAGACRSQDAPTVKTGTYVGILYGQNSVGGEFDDTLVLTGPSSVFDVPRVQSGSGAGLILGFRSAGAAFEISYQKSNHDTTSILLGRSQAQYRNLDLDFKFDFLAKESIRPFGLFGIGFPRLTIKGSKFDGASFSDATYSGLGLNFGLGAAYYMFPQWAVSATVLYRLTRFSTVDGVAIDGALKGPGMAYKLATTYTF